MEGKRVRAEWLTRPDKRVRRLEELWKRARREIKSGRNIYSPATRFLSPAKRYFSKATLNYLPTTSRLIILSSVGMHDEILIKQKRSKYKANTNLASEIKSVTKEEEENLMTDYVLNTLLDRTVKLFPNLPFPKSVTYFRQSMNISKTFKALFSCKILHTCYRCLSFCLHFPWFSQN